MFISKFGFMFLSFTINDFAWAIKHKLFFLSYFINNNLNVRYLCVLNIYNVKMLVKYVLICDIFLNDCKTFVCFRKRLFLKKIPTIFHKFHFCLFVFCDLYGFLPRIVHSFKHIFSFIWWWIRNLFWIQEKQFRLCLDLCLFLSLLTPM